MATVYPRGRVWYLQWSDTGGQHRISLTKKFGVRTQAEAENYRLAKELEIGTGTTIISSAPLFKTFTIDYLYWYKREFPASFERLETILSNSLLPFFENHHLNLIGPGPVEFWKAKRLGEVSVGTVVKEFRAFKAMIGRAAQWGKIQFHPFQHVKPPKDIISKPRSFYSADQMKELYSVESVYTHHWRLFANTGLRRSEGQNLPIEQVFEDRIRVLSELGSRTKSGKWREIPLNNAARLSVAILVGERKTGLVMARINARSLTRAFDRDRKKAGLPGNLHWLRHTFISHLVMSGMNLRKVQILAGHANYSTTEKYAHLSPDHLKDLGGVEI
jgi:site-specific recombinase XerD